MSRLTITLDDDLHRALKETAARQGRSISSIIEESLIFRGIRDRASAAKLVEQARQKAQMREKDAMDLAIAETREVRRSQ
jgi:predicted transcriptional regulator